MPDVITTSQVAILASLHFFYIILIAAMGWVLLARPYRTILIGLASAGWVWSLAAMIDFNQRDTGFLSWFLDPSAERNFSAMATSIMLALIGVTAAVLFWKTTRQQSEHTRVNHTLTLRLYWLLLAIMFFFLAVDEYASIHEQFHLWRQGYLALGGSIALLSLVTAARENVLRPYIALFIVGLASLGFAGVIIDAFSNQNIIDIGSFNLTLFSCHNTFLGVNCRDYAQTEELWELVGACVMWLSLLSVARHWQEQAITKRTLKLIVGLWAFVIIGWLWLFPLIENQMARPLRIAYDDITVTGYTVSTDEIQPGAIVDITLYAQANRSLNVTAQGYCNGN
ncbi:MAG: hypothetical protein Q9P44_06190 [Anaerolineae bacterium]|nr:hypothetical protein [Anaerolineae bacterium]